MKFVKMHGCGNDYVYLDAVTDSAIEPRIAHQDWPTLVQRMSNRHKGIGSDGVIVLCKPTGTAKSGGAHVRMRMFNADGSESEMCGNGIRCVTKFAHDRLGIRANPMLVETGRGVLSITYETNNGKVIQATVDMGEPILEPLKIPVDLRHVRHRKGDPEFWIDNGKVPWHGTFVSMGNPHAVAFEWALPQECWPILDDLSAWRSGHVSGFMRSGEAIEHHPAFPYRTNVHWAKCIDRQTVNLVTWERGAGITQACGTGACATLVAGVLTGRLERAATINVLGGELRIRWDEASNHVFMTGEAIDVFEGVLPDR